MIVWTVVWLNVFRVLRLDDFGFVIEVFNFFPFIFILINKKVSFIGFNSL